MLFNAISAAAMALLAVVEAAPAQLLPFVFIPPPLNRLHLINQDPLQ